MMHLGDYLEDATVYIPFTTNAADGGRESFSATLEEADIVILKNGAAMTLDASTITISLDLGSRVGFHVVSVDMSNDADFTTGADYAAMLYASDETLDAQAPAGVLATWSCQNRVVDVARISGSSTAADNAETCFTGTITTLDALDTAQDTQHGTTQTAISNLNDFDYQNEDVTVGAFATAADTEMVNNMVSGLTQLHLNQLCNDSAVAVDIADNSIIAKLVSKSATADWDDYDNTTDSLQAIRDRGDSAWTTGAGGTPPQLLQSTTIATLASQTSFTLTAGSADDDAYNGHLAIVTDQSTSTQKCVGIISDYTGSSKTVTLDSDPGIFTMAVGDTIDIVAVNTAASAPTVTQIRQEMDSNSTQLAKLGTITDLGNGATIGANLGDIAGATFTTSTDSLEAVRNRGDAAWITATGFSTLVATDILSDGTALNTTGGALDNVTLVDTTTTNSDMRGTDSAATAAALATVDTVVDTILATVRITTGSVTTGITPTATNFTTTLTAADDAYNDLLIRFTSGTLSGQVMPIDLYENAGGEISLAATHEAFTAAPSNGDTFDILPYHVHPISQIVNAQYDQDTTENETAGSRGKQLNDLVATVGALNNISAADVNAQVVDALNVDTYAEPGQGTPSATASLVAKIGYLYKAWRNRSTQDASTYELYNDDGTTVDQKATVSDDGTDFDRGEVTTGP